MSLPLVMPAAPPASTENCVQRLVSGMSGIRRTRTWIFYRGRRQSSKVGIAEWHLERRGWQDILIKAAARPCRQLRKIRTARVFAVACSPPKNDGRSLPFYAAGAFIIA